ncbi:MAG: helix-turn-helix domain-containing protein [Promethearchaeota archaeon]
MESKKANNYKTIIMKKLDTALMGLTITEISEKTGFHRNTVSKYLNILEAEDLVYKKEISAARVYVSKRRKYVKRDLLSLFIQALFRSLKDQFPNKESTFKEVGKMVLEDFHYPISIEMVNEYDILRNLSDPNVQLKLFEEYYNSFDVVNDNVEVILLELKENKAIYRLKNLDFLDPSRDLTYFFYFACGFVESIYLQILNQEVECNVKKIHRSKDIEGSYVDISLEIL